MANSAASKLLQNQLKKIVTEPVEGFTAELKNESNMFEWKIFVEGPKDSPYEGGVFQMQMNFPNDYPMSPPVLRFTSEFWHPNVYPDGKVCISILHPPGHDEMSGELPGERWMPSQSVNSVILSVMSMLGDPNFSSPANVDASVEWRKQPDAFKRRVRRLVEKSQRELPSHIRIPHPDTNPEERKRLLDRQRALEEDPFELNDDAYGDLDDSFDGDDPLDEDDEDNVDDGDEEDPSDSSAQKNKKPKQEAAKKAAAPAAEQKKAPGSPAPAPAPAPARGTAAPTVTATPAAVDDKKKADKAAPAPAAPPAAALTSVPATATAAPPGSTALGTPKKDASSSEKRDKKEKKDKDKKKSKSSSGSTPKKDKSAKKEKKESTASSTDKKETKKG